MTAVGVTGHQDIPSHAVGFIENGVRETLLRFHQDFTGISSLAAGADQIFATLVLQMGGALRVVLPCENYATTFGQDASVHRFQQLLQRASRVETLAHDSPSEEAYLEAGRRIADLSDLLVAIWDGKEAKGMGGTADIVRYAQVRGVDTVVIWPRGLDRK
ncbi:MAG: hypothetical protein WA655_21480 [Candidatus Korobacteraceae bacterium]